VQRKAFSGPFCWGVTQKTGEAEGNQRDAKEAAKKSDGVKTRSWAGATPLFGPSVSKVTRGVAPAHRRTNSAECFDPVANGRGKRRELEDRKEKRVLGIPEQSVILKRKVRLQQHASELLEDYVRFSGISADDVLNIVLKKMIANDMEFQSWLSKQNVRQEDGPVPLGASAGAENREAA